MQTQGHEGKMLCKSYLPPPFFFFYPPVLLTVNFAYAQHLNARTLTLLSSSGYSVVFNKGVLM